MSSLTSEIRRNTKLVIFTRDSVAALYQEKGSKHQDQLSQSDSAARKTQPLIHTGGAERATHVSSVVLWDRKNARTKLLKTRRKRDRIFFSNHQHFSSSLTPTTFFFPLLGPQLYFGATNFTQRGMLRVPEQHLQSEGT